MIGFVNYDEVESASGGAFITIAKMLKNIYTDLTVFGAIFDESMNVKTVGLSNVDDFKMFSGSKYVYSDLGKSFMFVSQLLVEEKHVLFSGTPCQVNGLVKYLKKNGISTDCLFTVDLICHGTPSDKLWKEYIFLVETKYKNKIQQYDFRFWDEENLKETTFVKFIDGTIVKDNNIINTYLSIYRKNLIMRECCYKCSCLGNNRLSDITLGDFWGVEKISPSFVRKQKVSVIIEHSEKGNIVIKQIMQLSAESKNMYYEVIQDYPSEFNPSFFQATYRNPLIQAFQRDYSKFGALYVLNKYGNDNLINRIRRFLTKKTL